MSRYDVHVCLVSSQPLPNLIPLFDEDTRPREVVLLVSDDMVSRAALLKRNIEGLGCRISEMAIPAYRIEEIRAVALDLLARREGQQVALNLTGGTKLMALGAYEVFRELGLPAFYVDTDNRQLITLLPQLASHPLGDLTTVKRSLAAYGYAIERTGSCQIAPAQQQLGDYLVKHVERLGAAPSACSTAVPRPPKNSWRDNSMPCICTTRPYRSCCNSVRPQVCWPSTASD